MSNLSTTDYGSTNSSSLTAFFDSRQDAQNAYDRLVDNGISADNLRLVEGNESDTSGAVVGTNDDRTFFEKLGDFFMGPDEDRYTYAEGLRRGGYLLTVSNLTATNHDAALDILDDEGTIDIDSREQSWRSEGWSGYDAGAAERLGGRSSYSADNAFATDASYASDKALPDTTLTGTSRADYSSSSMTAADTTAGYSTSSATTGATTDYGSRDYAGAKGADLRAGDEEVIPVIEEQIRVGKRDVARGRVRVRSYVVETPVSEQVNLREESVQIDRRPVDRALTGAEDAFRDRTIEAEERREEAVVSKDARVKEEISLRKDATERQETVSDSVRRTEVEVEDERGETLRDEDRLNQGSRKL